MTILHKNLPDSELHEPKGVASAPANHVYVTDGVGSGTFKAYGAIPSALSSAPAGNVIVSDGSGSAIIQPYDKEPKGIASALADQVYVANGSGSGVWKDLPAPPIVIPPTFASIIAQGNSNITLAAAADQTLQTNSDYVPLNNTGMWVVESNVGAITASQSSGQVSVTNAGYYHISLSGVVTGSAASSVVGIIFGNGTAFKVNRSLRDVSPTNGTFSIDSIVQLASGETIAPYIGATTATTITMKSVTFIVMRLS